MIYLIGGPPRFGKSTLAKQLAKKLGLSCIPIDALESLPRFYTLKKDLAKRFPKDATRKSTQNSNELMYTKFTAKQIAKAYMNQAEPIWPAVEVFVTGLITDTPESDFIVEGYQLPPSHVAKLLKRFPRDIRVLYLIREDPKAILAGFHAHKEQIDWVKPKSQTQDIYPKIAQMLSVFGSKTRELASAHKLATLNTEHDFHEQIKKGLQILCENN